MRFVIGYALATFFTALIAFAVLPGLETFEAFSLAVGLYLVPVGALMAQPWQTVTFTAMVIAFVPLLAPANQMSYDPMQYYNFALAIVTGLSAAALSFRLLPPLSPAFRTRRLLTLTLRDLRRLATGPIPRAPVDWEGRICGRLAALPDAAEPLQRSQLLAALSVSNGIIQLRHIAPRLGLDSDVDAALEALAQGNSAIATARPARLDDRLASLPSVGSGASLALQARGSILAISEAHRACLLLQRRSAHVRFTEIDVFGVYIAPMSLMMVVAWLVTVALRAVAKQETVDEVADAMSPAPEDSCSYTLHIGCAAISQA